MEHSDRRMGDMFRMDKRKTLFYYKDGGTLEEVNALSLEVFGIKSNALD